MTARRRAMMTDGREEHPVCAPEVDVSEIQVKTVELEGIACGGCVNEKEVVAKGRCVLALKCFLCVVCGVVFGICAQKGMGRHSVYQSKTFIEIHEFV